MTELPEDEEITLEKWNEIYDLWKEHIIDPMEDEAERKLQEAFEKSLPLIRAFFELEERLRDPIEREKFIIKPMTYKGVPVIMVSLKDEDG